MNALNRAAGLVAYSMAAAWRQRFEATVNLVEAAVTAPRLFKLETIEQARRDYYRAVGEIRRWSA